MTTWAAETRRPASWPGRLQLLAPLAVALVGAPLLGRTIVDERWARLAIMAALLSLVAGVGFLAPKRLLYLLVVWLAVFGLLRRLASLIGDTSGADPLLMVEPLALAVLALIAVHRGAARDRSRLSNGVLLLSLLMLVSAFNPAQGTFVGGLAGLLFTLVPMLAFWIGRGLDERTLWNVLRLFAFLAVPAAIYGLVQTHRGFPFWDRDWIQAHPDYVALNVESYVNGVYGTAVRPFSSFTAASEYAYFVVIGLLIWLILARRLPRILLAAAPIALLAVAALYQSSRGVIVTLIVAFGLIIGARRGLGFGRTVAVAVACLIALPFVVSRVVPANYGSASSASPLVAHQVQGLANPLDPKRSTLGVHVGIMITGFRTALEHPLGVGVGAVSIAGSKFGGTARGTEADPSNVAVALGLPGFLTYLVVLAAGFLRAYRVASRRRDYLALTVLGVLALTSLQWLNGGQYAVAFLPWLLLGWVDREQDKPYEPDRENRENVSSGRTPRRGRGG